jgi:hypothetical protein
MDLSSSSNEKETISDTSHDFEFAQRLFSELNRALLGPPVDDKIIILTSYVYKVVKWNETELQDLVYGHVTFKV